MKRQDRASSKLRIVGLIEIHMPLKEGVFNVPDCLKLMVEVATWLKIMIP